MGIGDVTGGKLNLVVSMRFNASGAVLDQWKTLFGQVSSLLFEATGHRHQIGKILVCPNNTATQKADIHVAASGSVAVTAPNGFGTDAHAFVSDDPRTPALIVLHELGHYVYNLREEYEDDSGIGGFVCLRGVNGSPGCIMEAGVQPSDATSITQFCNAGNHNATPRHSQNTQHNNQSCWETMVTQSGAWSGSALSANADPNAQLQPIRWIPLEARQHFALVIDRSGSMAGAKMAEAKTGARWWVDRTGRIDMLDTRMAVFSFSDSPTRNFPASGFAQISNEQTRGDAEGAIENLNAGGMTAIGDALRMALNAMPPVQDSAHPVIVLLTDGHNNRGEAPSNVFTALRARNVQVHIIGIGPDINAQMLNEIATGTNGQFRRAFMERGDERRQEFDIRVAMHEISGIAQENGGIVLSRSSTQIEGRAEALIEQGCGLATFLLSWQNPREPALLQLVDPTGKQAAAGPGVHVIEGGQPYMAYQVESPEPGAWEMQIDRKGESAFQLMVFSENPSLGGSLFTSGTAFEPGDVVPLFLQVFFNTPLVNLRVSASARTPDGGVIPVDFGDDGKPDIGDEKASDGVYSALFQTPGTPGTYEFEVLVENDGSAALARGCLVAGTEPVPVVVPPFQRRFTLTLPVGREEPRSAELDPNAGRPGEELVLSMKSQGIRLRSGETEVDLGEGITTTSVRVEDSENCLVTVEIDSKAKAGPRMLSVATPSEGESFQQEGAFTVGDRKSKYKSSSLG